MEYKTKKKKPLLWIILAAVVILIACVVLVLVHNGSKHDVSSNFISKPTPRFVAEDYDLTGTCGEDVQWGFKEETGELVIIGTGEMEDDSEASATWRELEITSVSIYGVSSIGNHAFLMCESLTEATIPNSVTSIGEYAFAYCSNLTAIHANSEYFVDVDGVLYTKDKKTLVQYPGAKQQTIFTVPDSVTTIEDGAFYCCFILAEITIPDSVTSIGEGAFHGCYNLTIIHADSASYVDVDGVLYTKDMKTLVQYPSGKTQDSFTVPDGVTSLGVCAFCWCRNLTEIVLPEGITSIEGGMICWCQVLTTITIPSSVTSIDTYEFGSCRSLTDVYFTGTEEQWNAIRIGDGNEPLTEANIHFNS